MKRAYFCPHCRGLLNPGAKVIFVIERGRDRGLLQLSPEFGDYAAVLAESFPIEPGAVNDFFCPICHHELGSPASDNLVEILCRQPDGSEARVDFSRVAGEHAMALPPSIRPAICWTANLAAWRGWVRSSRPSSCSSVIASGRPA